jgi:hypothetical protein
MAMTPRGVFSTPEFAWPALDAPYGDRDLIRSTPMERSEPPRPSLDAGGHHEPSPFAPWQTFSTKAKPAARADAIEQIVRSLSAKRRSAVLHQHIVQEARRHDPATTSVQVMVSLRLLLRTGRVLAIRRPFSRLRSFILPDGTGASGNAGDAEAVDLTAAGDALWNATGGLPFTARALDRQYQQERQDVPELRVARYRRFRAIARGEITQVGHIDRDKLYAPTSAWAALSVDEQRARLCRLESLPVTWDVDASPEDNGQMATAARLRRNSIPAQVGLALDALVRTQSGGGADVDDRPLGAERPVTGKALRDATRRAGMKEWSTQAWLALVQRVEREGLIACYGWAGQTGYYGRPGNPYAEAYVDFKRALDDAAASRYASRARAVRDALLAQSSGSFPVPLAILEARAADIWREKGTYFQRISAVSWGMLTVDDRQAIDELRQLLDSIRISPAAIEAHVVTAAADQEAGTLAATVSAEAVLPDVSGLFELAQGTAGELFAHMPHLPVAQQYESRSVPTAKRRVRTSRKRFVRIPLLCYLLGRFGSTTWQITAARGGHVLGTLTNSALVAPCLGRCTPSERPFLLAALALLNDVPSRRAVAEFIHATLDGTRTDVHSRRDLEGAAVALMRLPVCSPVDCLTETEHTLLGRLTTQPQEWLQHAARRAIDSWSPARSVSSRFGLSE